MVFVVGDGCNWLKLQQGLKLTQCCSPFFPLSPRSEQKKEKKKKILQLAVSLFSFLSVAAGDGNEEVVLWRIGIDMVK